MSVRPSNPSELRERAVRMFVEVRCEYASDWAAAVSVADKLGIGAPQTLTGIRTSEARKVNPRKEEFLRLRAEGLTRAEARARVGADARSATDWDKGITIINRSRIYPDGRIVRYLESTLVGVIAERRMRAIGGSVDLNKVEKVIDARYLSLLEREQIKDLHRTGISIRKIAAELQRSPSMFTPAANSNASSATSCAAADPPPSHTSSQMHVGHGSSNL